jgi:hypothetical protein
MAGLGKREILGRLPVVGTAAKAFGRQFSTFLDVAKVEIWKALRETTPREQWNDVVQSLESMLMSGRMEAVGISGRRAMTERAFFLAPAYYRGGLNNVAGALIEKGVSGKVMRQAMGAYMLGGAALFVGVAKALGMDDKEILKRFNPARSDFMMWRVKHGNRTDEIGFGGFYRSLLRLAGKAAKTSIEHPGNWKSLDPKKNPFTQWYRGHAGPAVSLVWDMFSGKDYLGRDSDIRAIPKAMVPMMVEAMQKKPGQPRPTVVEAATTAVGMSAFPEPSQPNAKEMRIKAGDFMDELKLRNKNITFEASDEPSFRNLNQAISAGDESGAREILTELRKTRKPADILSAMKRYETSPFTGSLRWEKVFKRSLSPQEMAIYVRAAQERKVDHAKFMALWRRAQ